MSKFKVGDIVEITNILYNEAIIDINLYLGQRAIIHNVYEASLTVKVQPFYSHPVYMYDLLDFYESEIKLYSPPEYKVGDEATVFCKITPNMIPEEVDSRSIFLSWVPRMDKSIGHTYKVIEVSNEFKTRDVVSLNIYPDEPEGHGNYWFDPYPLSKVDSSANSYQCGFPLLKNLW